MARNKKKQYQRFEDEFERLRKKRLTKKIKSKKYRDNTHDYWDINDDF